MDSATYLDRQQLELSFERPGRIVPERRGGDEPTFPPEQDRPEQEDAGRDEPEFPPLKNQTRINLAE